MGNKLKFIFWGGKDIGNYVLQNLLKNGFIPSGIIAYQDILDSSILEEAEKKGSEVYKVKAFKKEQQQIEEFVSRINPLAFISVAFPFIISKTIIEKVKYPINIHTGGIPKYRGHHPLSAAFLNNEEYQGTTIHFMAEEVDAGDILLQDFVKVENEDDINTVKLKLIKKSFELLQTVIKQTITDVLHPKPQIGEVVWAPKRTPEHSKIDFSQNSRYLHNFIRALVDPYPNAFGFCNEKLIKIKKSISSNISGQVLRKLENNEYLISSGDGVLLVELDTELNVGDIIK